VASELGPRRPGIWCCCKTRPSSTAPAACRTHFLARLGQRLAQPGGPGLVLLLVKLGGSGAASTEAAAGTAEVLATYAEHVSGAFAGRLADTDFALCLPVAGMAEETAQSLYAALVASPALRLAGADVAAGGAEGLVNHDTADALAMAAAALAHAAASGRPAVLGEAPALLAAEGVWRDQLALALLSGQTRLAEYPVIDRRGHTLHLDCPLRVQLELGGDFHAAEHWLALARRSRLLPQVDLTAAELALGAIQLDGRQRAVHASPASLATPGFIGELAEHLAAVPSAARKLSVEIVDAPGEPALVAVLMAKAAQTLGSFGTRLGLEHSAAPATMLLELPARGVAYLKLSPRHHRGLAADAAMREYAQALVSLLHGLGVATIAEGADAADDLAALWSVGFDAATGRAVGGSLQTI
jgi:EAL domain-containing protein (putative c-di-GMP-specific phosphodiesterase class I)